MKKTFLIFLSLVITLFVSSCSVKYAIESRDYYTYLDTISKITVEYNSDISKETVTNVLTEVNNILLDIEKEFSRETTINMSIAGILESTLMKINNASGQKNLDGSKCVTAVSDDFIDILEESIKIASMTNRGFEPTIGPLTSLWDISGKTEYCKPGLDYDPDNTLCKIPSEEEIAAVLKLVDYNNIEIDKTNKTVYLKYVGMALDFGGIAKGYAADKVMNYLKQFGFEYIMVNLGGNIITDGQSNTYSSNMCKKKNVVPIGISNPFRRKVEDPMILLTLYEEGITVVSSGITERYIEVNGKTYHHLLSSTTGYPFDNEILMVSIIGKSSCIADALATGIYALGLEKGMQLIHSLEDYNAVFITKNKEIYIVGDIKYKVSDQIKNEFEINK